MEVYENVSDILNDMQQVNFSFYQLIVDVESEFSNNRIEFIGIKYK